MSDSNEKGIVEMLALDFQYQKCLVLLINLRAATASDGCFQLTAGYMTD